MRHPLSIVAIIVLLASFGPASAQAACPGQIGGFNAGVAGVVGGAAPAHFSYEDATTCTPIPGGVLSGNIHATYTADATGWNSICSTVGVDSISVVGPGYTPATLTVTCAAKAAVITTP